MDTYTFFCRTSYADDHGIRRDERQTRSPRFVPAIVREQIEMGSLADQLTEDQGKSRTYWLRKLGVL